jgi:Putative restriction endonuclease
VIEVAESSLVYDRTRKSRAYAASGIPEYWIVNLSDRRVEIRTDPDRKARSYRHQRYASAGDLLSLPGGKLPFVLSPSASSGQATPRRGEVEGQAARNPGRGTEDSPDLIQAPTLIHRSFQPRLAQGGKLALQYRWIFDRRSLLVNLQRETRIEPQHFRRLGSGLRFSAQLTVDGSQGQVRAQNVGVVGEKLLQGSNGLLRLPGQVIGSAYEV